MWLQYETELPLIEGWVTSSVMPPKKKKKQGKGKEKPRAPFGFHPRKREENANV